MESWLARPGNKAIVVMYVYQSTQNVSLQVNSAGLASPFMIQVFTKTPSLVVCKFLAVHIYTLLFSWTPSVLLIIFIRKV